MNAGLAFTRRYASAASHPHSGAWGAGGGAVGCPGAVGWDGAGSVVAVGGAVVAVVATVRTAGLVADREFLDDERGSRRAVKSVPDPAPLMSATPITTANGIARGRPNLNTHLGIGHEGRPLETHGLLAFALLQADLSNPGGACSHAPLGWQLTRLVQSTLIHDAVPDSERGLDVTMESVRTKVDAIRPADRPSRRVEGRPRGVGARSGSATEAAAVGRSRTLDSTNTQRAIRGYPQATRQIETLHRKAGSSAALPRRAHSGIVLTPPKASDPRPLGEGSPGTVRRSSPAAACPPLS